MPEWQIKLPLLTWAGLCAWFTDHLLACPLREAERGWTLQIDTWAWVPPLPTYWLHDSCKPLNSSETHGAWTLHPRAGVGNIHLRSAWLTIVLHPWLFFFPFCFYLLHQSCLLFPQDCFDTTYFVLGYPRSVVLKELGLDQQHQHAYSHVSPRLTESRNSASCIFKSPPGDSEACSSFRATVLKCQTK